MYIEVCFNFMKQQILFVIHRLDAGGAEKSLVSLLNSLPLDEFNIDLMAVDPTGIFRSQVPNAVNIVAAPRELICQFARVTASRFRHYATLKLLAIKIKGIIGDHIRGEKSRKQRCHVQYYNDIWRNNIPEYHKEYDVAVSYIDGLNYFVIDHVRAKKKILWCHNDYNKLDFVPEYDRPYYDKANKVCTISEQCKKSLIENFPQAKDKIEVVENISSSRIINAQADNLGEMEQSGDGFIKDNRFKIVSIGRLTEQKGFDYAIEAAKILKDKGLSFCWYILGEGPLRNTLEEQAEKCGVAEFTRFIGIRSNPYPYIKGADIFVMPSRYEGKSIALDEAKILCKPIVVTDYPSVHDAIVNGDDGLVVEINANSIAEGILKLYENKQLQNTFIHNLRKEDCSNEKAVVNKFLELIS